MLHRRQAEQTEGEETASDAPDCTENTVESDELLVEEPKQGASLGQILGGTRGGVCFVVIVCFVSGVASLVILVFYIFGMSWKLFKIHLGTYVEEEPVFLKYK